jgi:regulatory protein YycI of two-component signal transduction system YycFG
MLMHNLAVQPNKTNILIFHPKLKAFLFRSSVFNIITEMIFFSIACLVIVISLVYITVLKVKATCDPIIYPLSQFNHQFPAEQVQVMLDISKKCSSYSIQKNYREIWINTNLSDLTIKSC